MNVPKLGERVLADLLKVAPKGAYSRLVGAMARRRVPEGLRRRVYTSFARRVGADLSEAERPLEEYPTLDAFFTRRLRSGARPLDDGRDVALSPCDGAVAAFGTAANGVLIQAKGIDYRLADLLENEGMAERFQGGTYVTIYLAPRDYHRVHFSVGGRITGFQHIAGARFPVNAFASRNIAGVLAVNERLVTYQSTPVGEVATVMVAAVGVGNISVTYAAVETGRPGRGRPGERVTLEVPVPVRRGDELGTFHLGSTVVLLFEPGRVKLSPLVEGQRIRLGEAVAHAEGGVATGSVAA